MTALHRIERPRVALLNIGEEEIKGNDTIKLAASLLAASPLNYTGYIEGDSIFAMILLSDSTTLTSSTILVPELSVAGTTMFVTLAGLTKRSCSRSARLRSIRCAPVFVPTSR